MTVQYVIKNGWYDFITRTKQSKGRVSLLLLVNHTWVRQLLLVGESQEGLVMRITVFHQAVCDVAGFKDGFVVHFFCKCVHCPGNHLNSFWGPVPHIISVRNKHVVFKADSTETKIEFQSYTGSPSGMIVCYLLQNVIFCVFSSCKK